MTRGSGFKYGRAGLYVCHDPPVILCFKVIVRKWGGSYTIDTGFHYDFLPGMSLRHTRAGGDPIELAYLDHFLLSRLPRLQANSDADFWWPLDDYAPDAVAENVAPVIHDCLSLLNEHKQMWHNPRDLLESIPPEAVEATFKTAHSPERGTISSLLRGWESPIGDLTYALALTAIHLGNHVVAKQYASMGIEYINSFPSQERGSVEYVDRLQHLL